MAKTRDVRLLTRAELLASAKRRLAIAAGATVVLGVVVTVGRLRPALASGILPAIGVIALIVAMLATLAAAYRWFVGVSTSADYVPSASQEAMPGFEVDRELRRLRRMIEGEVGDQLCGPLVLRDRPTGAPPPTDPRSAWRRFVQSTALTYAVHELECDVALACGVVTVCVHVGRSARADEDSAHWVGMELCARRQWKSIATGAEQLVAARTADATLGAALARLIQSGYHHGAISLARGDAGVTIAAVGDHTAVVVRTMPQETVGGVKLRLGIADFVQLVQALDAATTKKI